MKLDADIREWRGKHPLSECFVLCDEGSFRHCWPLVADSFDGHEHLMVVPEGETSKSMETLALIWDFFEQYGATRQALLFNLGGGMVCDLGGLAASLFKRGISFVNIPTTLLAMVDAAHGGKTAVNFHGIKNEIGLFRRADGVLVDSSFLPTLPYRQLSAGYAEMFKHSLLEGESAWKTIMGLDLDHPDSPQFQAVLEQSIGIKRKFAEADPCDTGLRQALNLGHTFGHAFESFSREACDCREERQPLLHGEAVACGLICELYLSARLEGLSHEVFQRSVYHLKDTLKTLRIGCQDYPKLLAWMRHDKKNADGQICCSLLSALGQVHTGVTVSDKDIEEALDFYREFVG